MKLMWSILRADLAVYRRMYSTRRGALPTALRCLTSRGLLMLLVLRLDQRRIDLQDQGRGPVRRVLARILAAVGHKLVALLAKADLSSHTRIEGGVYLSDRGNLVIGAKSIGRGTVIHHCVTIGMDLNNSATPTVGPDVWIGPDCVVYGDIEIGAGATLLGGSVVTRSVPPQAVVAGNPARVLQRNFDNRVLRQTMQYEVQPQSLAQSNA